MLLLSTVSLISATSKNHGSAAPKNPQEASFLTIFSKNISKITSLIHTTHGPDGKVENFFVFPEIKGGFSDGVKNIHVLDMTQKKQYIVNTIATGTNSVIKKAYLGFIEQFAMYDSVENKKQILDALVERMTRNGFLNKYYTMEEKRKHQQMTASVHLFCYLKIVKIQMSWKIRLIWFPGKSTWLLNGHQRANQKYWFTLSWLISRRIPTRQISTKEITQ